MNSGFVFVRLLRMSRRASSISNPPAEPLNVIPTRTRSASWLGGIGRPAKVYNGNWYRLWVQAATPNAPIETIRLNTTARGLDTQEARDGDTDGDADWDTYLDTNAEAQRAGLWKELRLINVNDSKLECGGMCSAASSYGKYTKRCTDETQVAAVGERGFVVLPEWLTIACGWLRIARGSLG